jgi:hypothetical protein
MHKFAWILFACSWTLLSCNNKERNIRESDNVQMNSKLVNGEELIRMHCMTCHTLGYIEMQPDFSRKTWEKITNKMIKSFGAPIPDSAAIEIVDYLVSIKGITE